MAKVYEELAALAVARENCRTPGTLNPEWEEKHTSAIIHLMDDRMPSGSGFDQGTGIDLDRSNSKRLVFMTSFHHMDENGCYDGWTDHTVFVTASLAFEFDIRVTGVNRNDIKAYIADAFQTCLRENI